MEQVAASLDGFARARLTPDSATQARVRSRVMREASLRLAVSAAAQVAAPAESAPLASPRRGWSFLRRRVAPAMAAAGLVLVLAVGASAASQPGGPLFDARVWVETALLPSDPGERFDAELVALQSHLDAAMRAAEAGDTAALGASLEAYEALVSRTTAEVDAGNDADRLARLEEILEKHQLTLERVLGQVPPQARDAIEHAIDRSDHAIEVIDANDGPGPGQNNGQGPGQNNGQGASPSHGQPGAGPTKTPKPSKTPPGRPTDRPSRGPGSTD